MSPTQDQNLVQSFMQLLMSHIRDYLQLDVYKKAVPSSMELYKEPIAKGNGLYL